MNAIILAAGAGRRMAGGGARVNGDASPGEAGFQGASPPGAAGFKEGGGPGAVGIGGPSSAAGWDRPKCLLPCRGGTLLINALGALGGVGVDRVAIVVGFKQEDIRAAVGETPGTTFLENPDYASSNTLHSLYLARERLEGDTFLLNGDVWFDRCVLDRMDSSQVTPSSSAMAVVSRACGAEEVKVITDAANRVTRIGKQLDPVECAGESVGIVRFNVAFARDLIGVLERLDRSPGGRGLYYEAAVNELLSRHVMLPVRIAGHEAIEIDTPEDYARAQALWKADGKE